MERGFKTLRSQRNLSNNLPDDVVDSLLEAVRTTGVDYCKKYYTLKKQILKSTQGVETFTWADRNASIDIATREDKYSWEEAVDLVEKGYNKFSPTMAKLFMDMVNEKRIDVPAQDGKRGGAYYQLFRLWTVPIAQLYRYPARRRDARARIRPR